MWRKTPSFVSTCRRRGSGASGEPSCIPAALQGRAQAGRGRVPCQPGRGRAGEQYKPRARLRASPFPTVCARIMTPALLWWLLVLSAWPRPSGELPVTVCSCQHGGRLLTKACSRALKTPGQVRRSSLKTAVSCFTRWLMIVRYLPGHYRPE